MAREKPWDRYPYKVFVGYSHDDLVPHGRGRMWGEWLQDELEAFRVPTKLVGQWTPYGLVPERIRPVFRDRSDLSARQDLGTEISEKLDSSATLVVVCSPSAARSRYVNDEVSYFKASGRDNRVFAFIVDGEPNSGDERECFPPALRHKVSEAGEILDAKAEPIAADARPGKDGPDNALIKLVAGLLDVSPSELQERVNEKLLEQAKRAQRGRNVFAVIAVFALIAMALALASSFVAESTRNQALIAQSRFLARDASEQAALGNAGLGLLLSLRALPDNLDAPNRPLDLSGMRSLTESMMQLREMRVLYGHSSSVHAIYSPDGKEIATASYDGTAKLWDVVSGTLIVALKGHESLVESISFSRSGNRIVTTSLGTARIFDARNGALIKSLKTGLALQDAQLSFDGKRVLTIGDKVGQLWDADTGRQISTLIGHTDFVDAASFSPNGERIVTASYDGTARLWDGKTGQPIAVLRGHTSLIKSVTYSKDGTKILTSSYDGTARLWDATTGTNTLVFKADSVRTLDSAAISDDGTRVAAAAGKNIALWDAHSGNLLRLFEGHERHIYFASFSPDSERIVSCSDDHTARIWSVRTGKEIAVLAGHAEYVGSAAFSPDGQQVLTGSGDGTARVWDAGSRSVVLKASQTSVNRAALSNDGKYLVTADNGSAHVWDWRRGELLVDLRGHTDTISSVAFSRDGDRIVTGSWDGTARIWARSTGALLATVRDLSVWAVQFSPDGKEIATGSFRGAAIWDAQSGALRKILKGHTEAVNSIAYSPDGTRVATGSDDNSAIIWDLNTGLRIATLKGHKGDVDYVAFTKDGAQLLTFSHDDHMALLWDALTGKQLMVFAEPDKCELDGREVALSPDESLVATRCGLTNVIMWNRATGTTAAMVPELQGFIERLFFKPDGTALLVLTSDGIVHQMPLPQRCNALLARAQRQAKSIGLQFTPAEQRRHFLTTADQGEAFTTAYDFVRPMLMPFLPRAGDTCQ